MPRKKREEFLNEEAELQLREGRRRAALERIDNFDEDKIHTNTRRTLHAASQAAADTLLEAATGGDADKNAIYAAGSILDRTGHPPTRKVVNEKAVSSNVAADLLKSAIEAFMSMPQEMKDAFAKAVAGGALHRPREVIDLAPAPSQALIEAGGVAGREPSTRD